MSYVCYLLTAPNTFRTYIGITNNFTRRLRQHNSEIKGGARYTTSYSRQWKGTVIVGEFDKKGDALKFEWAAKHGKCRRKVTCGKHARVRRMMELAVEHNRRILTCETDYPTEFVDLVREGKEESDNNNKKDKECDPILVPN